MMPPMMPSECHPALAEFADAVRHVPPDLGPIQLVAPPADPLSCDVDSTAEIRVLALHRERASASLLPQYGRYVWDVWVDEHGRQIAGEEIRWWSHPDAYRLPEWNPGPTFVWNDVYGWVRR